jgi:Phage endonuclease I
MPSFKSKLEEKVWAVLKKEFSTVKYEPQRFKFIQPEVERTYIPDFKIGRSNIFIEAKGKLDLETRKKMVWFRDSNPTIRIIFLFMNPDNKITKRSKTTYAMWATDNGFEWLDFRKDWLNAYKQLCRK